MCSWVTNTGLGISKHKTVPDAKANKLSAVASGTSPIYELETISMITLYA